MYSEPDAPPFPPPEGERGDECGAHQSWEMLRIQIVVYQVREWQVSSPLAGRWMVVRPERASTALSCGRRRRGRVLFSAEVGGLAGRAIISTEPVSKNGEVS